MMDKGWDEVMQESISPETGFTLIPVRKSGVSKSCSYLEATG